MRQTTICWQFVYILSTFCLIFVLVLSCFCPRFVTTKTKKNCHLSRFSRKSFGFVWFLSWKIWKTTKTKLVQIFQDKNQTNPKLFPENLDKWQFFCLCCDKSWTKTRQNQDKNRTKSWQKVDKLSTNCRLSHSLASPSGKRFFYWKVKGKCCQTCWISTTRRRWCGWRGRGRGWLP